MRVHIKSPTRVVVTVLLVTHIHEASIGLVNKIRIVNLKYGVVRVTQVLLLKIYLKC